MDKQNRTRTFQKLLIFSSLLVSSSGLAHAQWEVESDPTAFALKGFSAHVARPLSEGKYRLQVGAFGSDVPEWVHGNSDFQVSDRGATLKLDHFPLRALDGLFVGVDCTYSRLRYELKESPESTSRNLFALGPRVGYRFNIGKHFYISPWVSVGYQFNARDVSLSGKTLSAGKFAFFPAVHVGWRF